MGRAVRWPLLWAVLVLGIGASRLPAWTDGNVLIIWPDSLQYSPHHELSRRVEPQFSIGMVDVPEWCFVPAKDTRACGARYRLDPDTFVITFAYVYPPPGVPTEGNELINGMPALFSSAEAGLTPTDGRRLSWLMVTPDGRKLMVMADLRGPHLDEMDQQVRAIVEGIQPVRAEP
ncbi:MAG: hypothetical protein ABIZ71_01385 [Gemmatimonadales bacterium]